MRFRLAVIASICLPAVVVLSLWIPVFDHYYVPRVTIPDDVLAQARTSPAEEILQELSSFRFFHDEREDHESLIRSAGKMLEGVLEVSWLPKRNIGLPFDPNDLDRGQGQLFIASFGIPRFLLSAYEVSGREEFLRAARDAIVAWAGFENSAWLPRGLLWNDHAVSERALVLAEFWRLYRRHPDYQPEMAKVVLELSSRYGRLLARPDHFTFNTNHGVVQNLALWHLSLAFPALPGIDDYKRLALRRMDEQMAFYVSDDGVVLEHSPGYHAVGLRLISMAMRYLTLLDMSIPEKWIAKYNRGKLVFASFRRPDGSLPVFGDTISRAGDAGVQITDLNSEGKAAPLKHEKVWAPEADHSLYPAAGYSVWWSGLNSHRDFNQQAQTVVAWSHFPGQAHKHADEMSLSIWAGGQNWLTNVGYWPYGKKGRSEAVSWIGSNAVHLVTEGPDTQRETKLRYHGWSDTAVFIDLERSTAAGHKLRRQVFWKKPNFWLVLDHVKAGENLRARTVWNTSHDVNLSKGSIPYSFELQSQKGSGALTGFFFSSEDSKVTALVGSFSPFAGWDVPGDIMPAPAIMVEQPAADSWSGVAWSLHNGTGADIEISERPRTTRWDGADRWEVLIAARSSPLTIQREGDKLFVNGKVPEVLQLSVEPASSSRYEAIRKNFLRTASQYPEFKEYFSKRITVTLLVLLAFALQEGLFFLYRRKAGRHYTVLRYFSVLVWCTGVGFGVYFNEILESLSRLRLS